MLLDISHLASPRSISGDIHVPWYPRFRCSSSRGSSFAPERTPDDLHRNLRARPHAKLFLPNSPVNPTGQLYSAAELVAPLQVCVEHPIFFVLDRLYWRIVFDRQVYPERRIDDQTQPPGRFRRRRGAPRLRAHVPHPT